MRIDVTEIERIGGRKKNPDIDAALRLLEVNGLIVDESNPPKVEQTGFHLGGRTIRCEADDCMGPHTTAACVEDAVVQWNQRAPVAAPPLSDEARSIIESARWD